MQLPSRCISHAKSRICAAIETLVGYVFKADGGTPPDEAIRLTRFLSSYGARRCLCRQPAFSPARVSQKLTLYELVI